MNVLIILAHPEPKSFTASLANLAANTASEAGHAVKLVDLYKDRFNPVFDRSNFKGVYDPEYFKPQAEERYASNTSGFADELAAYQDLVLEADLLLLTFPLWWGGLPAVLKGWVDRVFASGKLYGQGQQFDTGVQRGKRGGLILTTGGPESSFVRDQAGGLNQILHPIRRNILEFVGYDTLSPFVAHSPARATQQQRLQVLERFRRHSASWF